MKVNLFGVILNYKKKLLLRCIHHFKSDLINNMDHMRISGTEPSSVIRSQKRNFIKVRRDVLNVPKQAEAKRDRVIIHKITISNNFNTENFDALKRYESTEELGYMCTRGLTGPPAVTLTK